MIRLLLFAGGMVVDRAHELLEDVVGDALGRAVMPQQVMQVVVAEIVVRQLEQGSARLLAEPQNRPLDQRPRPFHIAQQPRRGHSGQLAAGSRVDQHRRVGVLLQVRSRHPGRDRAFGHFADDLGLMLAQGDEQDLAGVIDRAQAHREGLRRHVGFTVEVARQGPAGDRIERAQPRPAAFVRIGLVAADMTVGADAEQQDVDAAGAFDFGLELAAMAFDRGRRRRAVEQMHLACGNFHRHQQLLAKPVVVALHLLGFQPVQLVQSEYDHP